MKVGLDFAGSLRSKRDRYFPLQNALLELIDNSVDEGATTINVIETEGDLIIEDNGQGFKDIGAALVIGRSAKDKKIGRFGVGLKDACIRYSNTTIIESNGLRVTVPWKEMIDETHDENIEDPQSIEVESMTRIILQDFRTRYSKAIEVKEIRRTYQPLIEGEKLEISITGKTLEPLPLPIFTEALHREVIFDGKKLVITGGIYASNDPARSDWKGYNPYYNGRLIGSGKITSSGTGDEGCTNFVFMVHLLDDLAPWGLATNKDEVSDLDALLDHLYHGYTREILERGAAQAMDIELKGIEDKVNAVLNTNGNITRAARRPQGSSRKTEAKEGSPKRNTKTATTSGVYMNGTGGKRGRVRFVFSHLGGESMGEIQDNGKAGLVITANLDNPFIAANKNNDSVILFFAKLAHAMHRQLCGNDLLPGDLTTSILEQAGEELAFSEKLVQSA
jgi:hypothetical protein